MTNELTDPFTLQITVKSSAAVFHVIPMALTSAACSETARPARRSEGQLSNDELFNIQRRWFPGFNAQKPKSHDPLPYDVSPASVSRFPSTTPSGLAGKRLPMSLDVKDAVAVFCSSPQPRKHGGKAMTGCRRALDRSGRRGGTVVAADPNPSAFSERQRASAVVVGSNGRLPCIILTVLVDVDATSEQPAPRSWFVVVVVWIRVREVVRSSGPTDTDVEHTSSGRGSSWRYTSTSIAQNAETLSIVSNFLYS
ncbi:hypothetical protein B0T13DRAFT_443500 [Neurospora crassa]|nr:hypothetical protein B0T13DRAFT_443500 [Neurospora crassa]